MTPIIDKSDRIQRSIARWGLLGAILCVGLAALTGYAAGRDVSRSLEHCIFTVPTVATVIGLSWLLVPIVAEIIYRRQLRHGRDPKVPEVQGTFKRRSRTTAWRRIRAS